MSRIVVVGSINMDIVNRVDSFPLPGETILGKGVAYLPGGKGANQAVAAARAGGQVEMVGAVGEDSFASALLDSLEGYGVGIAGVAKKPGSSGLAFITVADSGENQIILAAGSNGEVRPEDAGDSLLAGAAAVVLQNEIPWETNLAVMKACRRLGGIRLVYNPAPVRPIPEEAYGLVDLLVVNETEAEGLAGIPVSSPEEAEAAAKVLIGRGAGSAVVTLGSKGAVYAEADGASLFVPARKVKAVDTTAAGDTFIGALVVAGAEGKRAAEAMAFAAAASAVTVTRSGAQASIPSRDEIHRKLAEDDRKPE
ncbi:ribokinase [Cohnella fermenti]|uniref:Ribokinase n=1 Tax=Cohnella fermenti TaxID=2565925 RepID=A0A4S4C4I3_9BACL|nr:ribokinase [Cohnella fermenti]THF82639.1 ribokinase [Cohnella fermenti]